MKKLAMLAALLWMTSTQVASANTVSWSKLPRASSKMDSRFEQELRTATVVGSTLKPDEKHKLCFTDGQRRFEKEWGLSANASLIVEELVETGADSAELVVQNVTVGQTVQRVFVTGERRLPLVRVGKAPTGVKVFATRDEDGDVEFVVTDIETPKRLRKSGILNNQQLIQDDSGGFLQATCGFVHLSLNAKKRRAATVRNNIILSTSPRLHGATADVRLRGMYAHLSVSKLRTDRDPVVSVSFGWATAESIVEAPLEDE
ncbi:MAG TPA: hypothetical protein VFB62_25115 [Polyangiaceae bacterium]|jgi:hypothetical protein|nr:hypothetical protein [Polyangiaceae bacterium]